MSFFGDDEDEDEATDAKDDSAPAKDSDEDEGDQDAPAAAPASEPAPPAALPDPRADQMGPPVDDATKQQRIKDYLQQQYGQASDNSGVKQAQADASRSRTVANIGEALEGLAKSNSMAHGGAGVDSGFYQHQRDQANLGVQQATQSRQQRIQEFLQKNELGRQAEQDSRTSAEFGQKQKDWAQSNEDNTPGSAKSLAVISNFNKAFPGHEISPEDAKVLSANDVKGYVMGQVDIKAKIDENHQAAGMRAAYMQTQREFANAKDLQTKDVAFTKLYGADENKFADASGKIDQSMSMLDQATKGGVASQLVPLEVAKQIAGRLNPQEIAAASGDPSAAGKLERYFSKASDGTMTVKDAQEYRTLLQSQKDSLAAVRSKQREQTVQGYAKATRRDPMLVRALVTPDQPAGGGPQTASAPASGAGTGAATAAPSPQVPTLQDVQAEIARRKSGKVASK